MKHFENSNDSMHLSVSAREVQRKGELDVGYPGVGGNTTETAGLEPKISG